MTDVTIGGSGGHDKIRALEPAADVQMEKRRLRNMEIPTDQQIAIIIDNITNAIENDAGIPLLYGANGISIPTQPRTGMTIDVET